jgi:hypothetical protein
MIDPPETDNEGASRSFSIASAPDEPNPMFASPEDAALLEELQNLEGSELELQAGSDDDRELSARSDPGRESAAKSAGRCSSAMCRI